MFGKRAFTLIELVIVLSILIALMTVVVPSFLSSTEQAKLKSDIQTALIIHNAIELYKMEHFALPSATDSETLLIILKDNHYIAHVEDNPQLSVANWRYDAVNGKLLLDITACSEDVKRLATQLTEKEKQYVYQ